MHSITHYSEETQELAHGPFDDDFCGLFCAQPDLVESEDPESEAATKARLVKPPKGCAFRTRPGIEVFILCNLMTVKDELGHRHYLVAPQIARLFPDRVCSVWLVPYMNRLGEIHFWPVRRERVSNILRTSALDVMFKAQKHWITLSWHGPSRTYESKKVKTGYGEPSWPHDNELYSLLKRSVDGVVMTELQMPDVKTSS